MTERRRTNRRGPGQRTATADTPSSPDTAESVNETNPYLDTDKSSSGAAPAKKRPGRPRRTAASSTEDTGSESSAASGTKRGTSAAKRPSAATSATPDDTPKRRGRPRKNAAATEGTDTTAAPKTAASRKSAASKTTAAPPATSSDPDLFTSSNGDAPPPPKRRGRPPKRAAEEFDSSAYAPPELPAESPASPSSAPATPPPAVSSSHTDASDTPSFDENRQRPYNRGGRYRRFKHRDRQNQHSQHNTHNNAAQGQGDTYQRDHQRDHHRDHQRGYNKHRKGRRNRHFDNTPRGPIGPITVEGEATGWFDTQREAGFIRNATNSYLADPSDPFISVQLVRQYGLRRGDMITASVGRDQRNRVVVADILAINGDDPSLALRRPDFQSLIASYPDRPLTLETGKPAKGGPELTRRAIDLIAPIGYGQRALIVAPARAGKTMLLQAIIEGVATNHPEAVLFVLLVDERPEEVSDMIMLGHGEVIASSFDMPANRHTEVAEMTLERARRLVELGRDVVIVLDSITRLARAYNTVERGTGRTLSGGLDSSAMAKPKAFFGSARAVAPQHGGGSLSIIATALVETGSRMDDVIFEEFKGTGNCEIKLDRSLAEKRVFPAIDIAVSGTRREDKLFRPDQLENVHTLRRGLQQMPSSSAMEWLIKRIASTTNNDALLSGL